MQSKLILIEGIPGSGKSTTAQFVHNWMEGQGLPTYLFQEGQPDHPTDPDGLAYLEYEQYSELVSAHESFRYNIQDNTVQKYGGYIVNYRKMDQQEKLPDALYEALEARDIYATASPEKYREISAGMWQSFADQATIEEGIYIFECCFLQNPFTVLLGQHNCEPEEVKQHIRKANAAISPLFPLAIYLNSGSAQSVLQKAVDTRPQAWSDFVTEYITGQGYGKAHGLQGLEGVFEFYEMMKRFMETTLNELGIPMMRAEVEKEGWERAQQEIAMFLKAKSGYWGLED